MHAFCAFEDELKTSKGRKTKYDMCTVTDIETHKTAEMMQHNTKTQNEKERARADTAATGLGSPSVSFKVAHVSGPAAEQSISTTPEFEAAAGRGLSSGSRTPLQAQQSETVRTEGAAVSATQGPVSPVDDWLAQCKLQRYAGAIDEAGYDEIDFLKEADEAEIDDLASQVEMKVPDAKALKRAWLKLRDT